MPSNWCEITDLRPESNLVEVCHTLRKRKVSGTVMYRVRFNQAERRFDVSKARIRKF